MDKPIDILKVLCFIPMMLMAALGLIFSIPAVISAGFSGYAGLFSIFALLCSPINIVVFYLIIKQLKKGRNEWTLCVFSLFFASGYWLLLKWLASMAGPFSV